MLAYCRSRRADLRFLLVLAVVAVGTIGMLMYQAGEDGRLLTPANAVDVPGATAKELVSGGSSIGEVLVGSSTVFRIRTAAGGLSPYERAQKVAGRLDDLIAKGVKASDIKTGVVKGMDVVLAGDEVVVTADRAHAEINGTTSAKLAQQWAGNVQKALGGEVTATASTPATEPEPEPVPTASKIVPIISVGSGLRIGGAQVTGPKEHIEQVKAVAQIEGDYKDAIRVRLLVPVSTENIVQNLSRVPQTSVTGLVDLKL